MKSYLLIACSTAMVVILSFNTKKEIDKSSTLLHNTVSAIPETKPIDGVINYYLQIKNALAADNSKEAATAGGKLKSALIDLGKEVMNPAQKKVYTDDADDAIEDAEHISQNAGNIKHQREHFEDLSDDMYDIIKAFGTTQTLYKDYCPMKKASWLSEFKEIKNPYYGKSMLTCGSVKETISKP